MRACMCRTCRLGLSLCGLVLATAMPGQRKLQARPALHRIVQGYYLYQYPARGKAVPAPLAFSRGGLTNGKGNTDFTQTSGKFHSKMSVVLDLLRDRPLDRVAVDVAFRPGWWHVSYVTLAYRAGGAKRYRLAGTGVQACLKARPRMVFQLHGAPAKFVKITVTRPWPTNENMSLKRVAIWSQGPGPRVAPAHGPPPADGVLRSEFSRGAILVDRFGQYLYQNWPAKIHSDRQLVQATAQEKQALAHARFDHRKFDRYGGLRAGPTVEANGFFQLRKIGGRWWFITPEGHRFFWLGVDGVYIPGTWTQLFKPHTRTVRDVFSALPDRRRFLPAYHLVPGYGTGRWDSNLVSFRTANDIRKYGPDFKRKWLEIAYRRLLAWGFNAEGKWCPPHLLRFPYIVVLEPQSAKRVAGVVDPFDPGFRASVVDGVKATVTADRGDPWLLGYTFESETGWRPQTLQRVLRENANCAAKKALIDFLARRYRHDLAKVNSLLNTHARSFSQLVNASIHKAALPKREVKAFIRFASRRYYRIVSRVVKKYDPNHLFLGSWLGPGNDWDSSPAWVTGGRKYVDAFSFDYYGSHAGWLSRYQKYDKPVLVGEFSFTVFGHGLLANSSTSGIASQKARGLYYRYLVERLAASRLFVGCAWFAYYDNPATGNPVGESANYGLCDICDQPYLSMVRQMAKTNHRVYGIHAGRLKPVTRARLGLAQAPK